MNRTRKSFLVISHSLVVLFPLILTAQSTKDFMNKPEATLMYNDVLNEENNTVVAVNDTFEYINGCNNGILSECVIVNDNIIKSAKICYVFAPSAGTLSFGTNGNFLFTIDDDYEGIVVFKYRICDPEKSSVYHDADVYINVKKDNDCDNVPNEHDLDDDNDGILDIDEYDGTNDSDNDGIPNSYDIDSDNDGIADITEWQREGSYVVPSGIDNNGNGWDDVFDTGLNGEYYKTIDSDNDGIPDFLDIDSDNDGISDNIEAYDENNDGFADILPTYADIDLDGLDNAYDTINDHTDFCNSFACLAPLPDHNSNGIRDWREAVEEEFPENENPVTGFETNLYFYPNPSRGLVHFNLPSDKDFKMNTVQLYNLSGVKVLEEVVPQNNFSLDFSEFSKGTYILRLINNNLLHTERIQIIR